MAIALRVCHRAVRLFEVIITYRGHWGLPDAQLRAVGSGTVRPPKGMAKTPLRYLCACVDHVAAALRLPYAAGAVQISRVLGDVVRCGCKLACAAFGWPPGTVVCFRLPSSVSDQLNLGLAGLCRGYGHTADKFDAGVHVVWALLRSAACGRYYGHEPLEFIQIFPIYNSDSTELARDLWERIMAAGLLDETPGASISVDPEVERILECCIYGTHVNFTPAASFLPSHSTTKLFRRGVHYNTLLNAVFQATVFHY